jgi:hypothetical protein
MQTQAAGGCILIAAWQEVSGRDTLIVAATFGQPGTAATILPNALQAAPWRSPADREPRCPARVRNRRLAGNGPPAVQACKPRPER